MARPLRLELADGWYHVTGRGNERKAVFRNEADRHHFLALMGEIEARYGVEVHGYVLMENHYHLLLRLKEETGLSAAMHWLLVSYTVWFNHRHRRSGHLFQGRFKAILVEFDRWGASLSRYIHLNPVRLRKYGLDKKDRVAQRNGLGVAPTREIIQKRLKALQTYRWSSYRQYAGTAKPTEWLHRDAVLSRFGRSQPGVTYRQYVEESIRAGQDESPWEELKAGFVLGGEELLEKVGRLLKGNPREQSGLKQLESPVSLQEIAQAVSSLKGKRWEEFIDVRGDWGRDMALLLARRNTSVTNARLAEWVGGIDDSAVSQAVRRLAVKMKSDPALTQIFEELEFKMSFVKT